MRRYSSHYSIMVLAWENRAADTTKLFKFRFSSRKRSYTRVVVVVVASERSPFMVEKLPFRAKTIWPRIKVTASRAVQVIGQRHCARAPVSPQITRLSCTHDDFWIFIFFFFFFRGFPPDKRWPAVIQYPHIIWINSRIWIIYIIFYKNVRPNLTYIIFWGVMFPISRFFFSAFPPEALKTHLSLSPHTHTHTFINYISFISIVTAHIIAFLALFFASRNRSVSHSRGIVTRNGLTADRRPNQLIRVPIYSYYNNIIII